MTLLTCQWLHDRKKCIKVHDSQQSFSVSFIKIAYCLSKKLLIQFVVSWRSSSCLIKAFNWILKKLMKKFSNKVEPQTWKASLSVLSSISWLNLFWNLLNALKYWNYREFKSQSKTLGLKLLKDTKIYYFDYDYNVFLNALLSDFSILVTLFNSDSQRFSILISLYSHSIFVKDNRLDFQSFKMWSLIGNLPVANFHLRFTKFTTQRWT